MVAPDDALIGATLIQKYKIVRQIGRGGMGVVYEAEHIELGKRVAIKLMLEKYAEDSEAITRFKREALAASRIGNPHIIDISDIGIAPDGRSFVVMELLVGSSLADLLKRTGPLPPARAIDIMRQTLRAVGAAHGKNIIHRDLKPDNIFLVRQDDQHDFVKLLDFGISKIVDQAAEIAATKLTTTGTVMGTPLYMAPEQAMGEVTDQRADIYALGVILYEMLAGKPPFDGVTYPVLVVKLLTADPELLSTLRPGLPSSLVAAVHRALEKEPSVRFPTCDAFAAALPAGEHARPAGLGLDQTMNSGEVAAVAGISAVLAKRVKASAPSDQRSRMPIIIGAVGGGLVVALLAVILVVVRGSGAPKAVVTITPIAEAIGGPQVEAGPPAALAPSVGVGSGSSGSSGPASGTGSESVPSSVTEPGLATGSSTSRPPPPAGARPVTKRPAPKTVAAVDPGAAVGPAPPGGSGATPPPTVVATRAATTATTADVEAAIKRRDGTACRAALAALTSPPSTDFRVASLHAVCEMVAGNCEGGIREQRALYVRDGSPPDSATIIADLYCPIGTVPDVRLRRLAKQISMFSNFDCDYYLGPARAAAKVAQSDQDRRVVGSILASIATCYSRRDRCDTARKVLGEAQVFIPALALNELKSSCR